jgi:hypothetical protein
MGVVKPNQSIEKIPKRTAIQIEVHRSATPFAAHLVIVRFGRGDAPRREGNVGNRYFERKASTEELGARYF